MSALPTSTSAPSTAAEAALTVCPSTASPPVLDDSSLPQGQCQYLLLVPGLKGQRCGCAHFSLNRGIPGARCECGHMACYHVQDPEVAAQEREMEALKHRIKLLEHQVRTERNDGLRNFAARLCRMEDRIDHTRDEVGQEFKGSYRNIARVWHSVEQVERRQMWLQEAFRMQAGNLTRISSEMRDVRNRHLELFDADLSLEERLDLLEQKHDDAVDNTSTRTEPAVADPSKTRRPLPPTPEVTPDMAPEHDIAAYEDRSYVMPSRPADRHIADEEDSEVDRPVEHAGMPASSQRQSLAAHQASNRLSSEMTDRSADDSWTVHISLLPSPSHPFPFERHTLAYKRCLSRGLHRTVVVADKSAKAFSDAVNASFESVLQGRAWVPMKAKVCDANSLQGLPMLRRLGSEYEQQPLDFDFLRQHCAVCDASGNIESLYLSLRHEQLSWSFLKASEVVVPGLESAWETDQYLDSEDSSDDRAVTETAPFVEKENVWKAKLLGLSLPLKRKADDARRSTPTTDEADDQGRNKIRRGCLVGVADSNRGIETM